MRMKKIKRVRYFRLLCWVLLGYSYPRALSRMEQHLHLQLAQSAT